MRGQAATAAAQAQQGRKTIRDAGGARPKSEGRHLVLQDLRELTQERRSRDQTVFGRFLQCQELQMCSALLGKAIEQCSRWHRGRAIPPPGGSLPPST